MNTNYFLNQSTKKIISFILIIPIIIQFVLINLVQAIRDERLYYLTFIFFWTLYLPYFFWLNIAVNFLYSHSSKYFKIKFYKFKISLIINMIIILNFVFFVAYMFSFVFNGGRPKMDILFYMLLVQIIGIFSYIYNSYFICKLIATIELRRNIYFSDIASNIIAFSFPPVALWIINSKIKRIQFTGNNSKLG